MNDFLSFRRMITPILIQVLFWVVSTGCVLFGLAALARGETLAALAAIVIGPFVVRIYCELLILFFRMNESLTEISKSVGGGAYMPARKHQQPSWGSKIETEAERAAYLDMLNATQPRSDAARPN